ncbi:MAG: Holliday junction branch migration protein RuvA [Verrucomicrobia bacterium]|nr:Holliday junction branch migration protein RuvA [Verrucomicrobiota bacterium]
MIAHIEGVLAEAMPGRVVLDVGGVGYDVAVPLSTYDRLPGLGARCRLLTHLLHRDDQMVLYGFGSEAERELFRMLIGVTGVGARIALAALSGLSVNEFKEAVAIGDIKRIKSIHGVGARTAERIIVELRERVGALPAIEAIARTAAAKEPDAVRDAVGALVTLGYAPAAAHKAVRTVLERATEPLGTEDIITQALRHV